MISPKGSPASRLWVLAEAPLAKDSQKGYLFSSPMGWSYDKMLVEAGLTNYFVTYMDEDNVTSPQYKDNVIAQINNYKPPLILALDTAGKWLLPGKFRGKNPKDVRANISRQAGSLLASDLLSYPHYIMPTFGPQACINMWTERAVVKYIDLAKLADEYKYWNDNGQLQDLPPRQLDIDTDKDFPKLLDRLHSWCTSPHKYLSADIESVYPRDKSEYKGHPGYPVLLGLALNKVRGMSFHVFREDPKETKLLWKALSELFYAKIIIGQNYYNYDDWLLGLIGMPARRFVAPTTANPVGSVGIYDTMFAHHVLWPELSHKLQLLTRQYTRQPYYKDENSGAGKKVRDQWMRYNALDACVTYEVFEELEKEFDGRPHLR